jgi:hypothetical protein
VNKALRLQGFELLVPATRWPPCATNPVQRDPAPLRDFPKYGWPLVYVSSIYGKAVGWTHMYALIEWLDSSGKYHVGWAQSSSIKRVKPEEWKGSGGL